MQLARQALVELLRVTGTQEYFLGCVSLGESENRFVIPDHMDSLSPKKRKIRKRIILSWQGRLEARNIYNRTKFLSYYPRFQLEWNTNNL